MQIIKQLTDGLPVYGLYDMSVICLYPKIEIL
jgi:hypothetical protein